MRAAEMWIAGMQQYYRSGRGLPLRQHLRKLWNAIYPAVFSDFERWDKLTKQYETGALRRNVKAYLRRQGVQMVHGNTRPHAN